MARLLPLILLCAMAGSATADGFYFSESVGGTRVKDELAAHVDDGMRVRLALGIRRRQWAIEGWVAGMIPDGSADPQTTRPGGSDRPDLGYIEPTSLTTFGFDLKYLQPVSRHLEVYLRGSMSRGEMSGTLENFGGRGLGVGAGIQLKGKIPALGFLWFPLFFSNLGPKITAALILDTGYEFYRLHGDRPTAIDAQLSHMTFGFAVGSDI